MLYNSWFCHWYIFLHIFFKFSLSLKLAGLCYHVKVLKYISFPVLCFCFELVTYDNSDMAIWICYSVPEYYDYGHGTSEEAYDSYGKVYSIFSKSVKSKEKNLSLTTQKLLPHTFLPFFPCFYKDHTKWICVTLGWGLTYWTRTRKLERSILIKITKPIDHSHRSL